MATGSSQTAQTRHDAFDNMPEHNIISRSYGSGDFVFGNDAASLDRTGLCGIVKSPSEIKTGREQYGR